MSCTDILDAKHSSLVCVLQTCYLAHEARDDAVEDGALVAIALLTGAQGAEVLSSPGHNVRPEL